MGLGLGCSARKPLCSTWPLILRRVTRAPSGDRRSKEQAGLGAAKPQSLGSQLPTTLLVPHLLGTGSHGASLDSSKRRDGLRLLAEGLHNRVTRKLETSVAGFTAIFHSVPQTPDDHMVHCFYMKVHCHLHDSVPLHSHEGGSREQGGKESWMKEEGCGHLSQVTPHTRDNRAGTLPGSWPWNRHSTSTGIFVSLVH